MSIWDEQEKIRKAYANLVKKALDNKDGATWMECKTLDDGRKLCLVMGWCEGYEKGEGYQFEKDGIIYTLCSKLAVNIDDLQCDFDMDWYMPWDKETNEVYDTCMAVDKLEHDQDIYGNATWYDEQANIIVKALNWKTMEVH